MILPIVAYGSPILRSVADDIDKEYEGLEKLLEDMWETMYNSNGVGLAAPQINKSIRLFVMNSVQIFENDTDGDTKDYTDKPGFKGVFINPHIESLEGAVPWVSVSSQFLGKPIMISSTASPAKYFCKKGISSGEGIVIKPVAIICKGSVTAMPVLFTP